MKLLGPTANIVKVEKGVVSLLNGRLRYHENVSILYDPEAISFYPTLRSLLSSLLGQQSRLLRPVSKFNRHWSKIKSLQ